MLRTLTFLSVSCVLFSTLAFAAGEPVAVQFRELDLRNSNPEPVQRALEISERHLQLRDKASGIRINFRVDRAGRTVSPNALAMKCLRSQISTINQTSNIQEKWRRTTNLLKALGIGVIDVTLHERANGTGAPRVSATMMDTSLKVDIQLVRDSQTCAVALGKEDAAENNTNGSPAVDGSSLKFVSDVIRETARTRGVGDGTTAVQ